LLTFTVADVKPVCAAVIVFDQLPVGPVNVKLVALCDDPELICTDATLSVPFPLVLLRVRFTVVLAATFDALPWASVEVTLAVKVPLFAMLVEVQVKKQGFERVPVEVGGPLQAKRVGEAAFTVIDWPPVRLPTVAVSVAVSALTRVTLAVPTPFVKLTLAG
jgi:hypothetical protein